MPSRDVARAVVRTLLLAAAASSTPLAAANSPTISLAKLPLRFEPNRGQSDPQVRFLARGSGYGLYLTSGGGSVMVLRRGGSASSAASVLRLDLVGANPEPKAVGADELAGKSHYFLGSDPAAWKTDVPQYARVELRDVYPGVDLTYYGNEGQIEYDFVVAPGADPKCIRFRVEGARSIRLDKVGNLALSADGGELVHRAPVLYQELDGKRQSVIGRYVRYGGTEIGFEIGSYDSARPLVIDPVLSYSTYLGGSGSDLARGIAIDSSGNTYIVGSTESLNFPTASPLQAGSAGSSDAFVAKLNASGSALLYSTYLGGSSYDVGLGIAVDPSGNAYVTGSTFSPDLPTANPLQASVGGMADAFVAKLNPSGSALLYSTYLGGTDYERGEHIAVDPSGHAYVTGWTGSLNFPTASPLQVSYAGTTDAFVAKLTASGSAFVYSTYLGGNSGEIGWGITTDSSENAYVTGSTFSTNFPTANALHANNAGFGDVFIAKINPSGSAFVYSTYLGGENQEDGTAIAVDASGNVYVAGFTHSPNFPTVNPFQSVLAGTKDAFVAKLNASGSALTYATYLGGTGADSAAAIAVDSSGDAYVAGTTGSTNFPLANPLQSTHAGNDDAFVTKLTSSGAALAFSTYLGGSGHEDAFAMAVHSAGDVRVTGGTASTNFPTASPLQAANAGSDDAFFFKIVPVELMQFSVD